MSNWDASAKIRGVKVRCYEGVWPRLGEAVRTDRRIFVLVRDTVEAVTSQHPGVVRDRAVNEPLRKGCLCI